MQFRDFIEIVRNGDVERTTSALDECPDLIAMRSLRDEDWQERTALHAAAGAGHLDLVRLLVDRGAEVYSHPYSSYPPLFIAYYAKRDDDPGCVQKIVDYFLKEIPDRAEGTRGLGATIHIAARLGFVDIVRKHIELDPLAVHARGWLGDTPLHWSCHNGHLEIVDLLLDAGADIEADEINCYGGKPLHWASEHEAHIVERLLARGAQVDSTNALRKSDYFGITPLLMNTLQRDDCGDVTRLLLDAGASTKVTYQGKSPLQIARDRGNENIANVLEESNGDQREGVRNCHSIPKLPSRPIDGHKGTFGNILIVAGSRGMAGAASLAGQAALHTGAGLVTVACPTEIAGLVATGHPSYMTANVASADGAIDEYAQVELQRLAVGKSAMAIGPGLGQSEPTRKLVRQIYKEYVGSLVVDADGLNALAGGLKGLDAAGPRLLTPHPGEFSRLIQTDVASVEAKRAELAIEFAREHDVVLLLKGHRTIVTDGNRLAVNRTGDDTLSTGGSGDVLTGILVALVGQGMDLFDAAQLAAHAHGLAGERCGVQLGSRFATSLDLIGALSSVWQSLERKT